jgi:hypothetical protein
MIARTIKNSVLWAARKPPTGGRESIKALTPGPGPPRTAAKTVGEGSQATPARHIKRIISKASQTLIKRKISKCLRALMEVIIARKAKAGMVFRYRAKIDPAKQKRSLSGAPEKLPSWLDLVIDKGGMS